MTKKITGKIMIVEDEVVIAMKLQKRLESLRYDIIGIAHSGEEVLEKARSLRPDLILMDIKIPGRIDGITAAEIVKSELNIPVIFLTAFSEDKIIERAKKAEPYGYLLKPFQDGELKAAIEVAFYKKEMENVRNQNVEKFRALAENANDGILIALGNGKHVYANKQAAEITGYGISDLLKSTIKNLAHPNEFGKIKERYCNIIAGKPFKKQYETKIIRKDGKEIPIEVTSARTIWEGQAADIVIIRDLTKRVQAEKALKKAYDDLEVRVKERTKELEIKTKNLEEINTAMNVLLKKREEDRKNIEDNVLTNVKGLIEPYMQKMKKTRLDYQQKAILDIIESNLEEIISPFARKISKQYFYLTPREIRIANLIKHGNSNKKIAEILNLSTRTVESHRKNIRSKIGLDDKRANLRSHLLSLD